MKRMTAFIVTALVAVLAVGVMAGCSSQSASSASASSASASSSSSAASAPESSASVSAAASTSASTSASAEQSQDPVVAELVEVFAKAPAFKSVTITEHITTDFKGGAEASAGDSSTSAASSAAASSESTESAAAASSESAAADEAGEELETIDATTVYKFDESGDKLKTSMTAELGDIKLQYFSNGEDAVCVTDGPVYSGTTEQFDQTHFAGAAAYLKEATWDLNDIVGCVATATKSEQDGMTVYELTLDPEKYMASDEILQIMAESGDPILSAVVYIGFDPNGYIVWVDNKTDYKLSTTEKSLSLSDFDSTVIEPMPQADKTYEEMEADIKQKLDAYSEELEKADGVDAAATGSSEAAEAN